MLEVVITSEWSVEKQARAVMLAGMVHMLADDVVRLREHITEKWLQGGQSPIDEAYSRGEIAILEHTAKALVDIMQNTNTDDLLGIAKETKA